MKTVWKGTRRPYGSARAVALLAGSLLLLACDRLERSSHRAIASLLAEHRIVEPRLTASSAHAPCREERKPASLVALPSCSRVPPEELARLFQRLAGSTAVRGEETARTAENPEGLHDLGMAYLMVGNTTAAQKAVAALEEATRRHPGNAALHSDLAAARIVLAGALGEPYELVRSLDSAEQALSLAPGLPAARFNRALALEKLSLASEARAAWDRYREVDPDSPWGQEAEARAHALIHRPWDEAWRERLAELEAAASAGQDGVVGAIVRADPQPVREMAQNEWLGDWADAWREGRQEDARTLLRKARTVGEALARESGDAMVKDAVAAIEAAEVRGRDGLAEAHRLYRDGQALFAKRDYEPSRELLRQAAAALQTSGSPLAGWADLLAAICVHYGSEYDEARRLFENLRHRPGLERYPALEGRLLYNLGIVRTVQADFSGGLAAYRRALSLHRRTGEVENLAAVRHVIAESLSFLGQTAESWRYRYLALTALDRIPVGQRRFSLLLEATKACLHQGHPAFALALQSETLRTVGSWQRGILRPHALLERSRTALALGRHASAWRDLEEAGSLADATADRGEREHLQAEVLNLRSRLLAGKNPGQARTELDQALGYYQKVGARLSLVSTRQERAKLHEALGDLAAMEADLHDGIAEYEAQRAGLARDMERVSFFEQSRALFDDMIALLLRQGRVEEALSYAERSRGRALLDHVAALPGLPAESTTLLAAEAPPFSAVELRRLLPPGVAVIEYHWIGERLCIWAITNQGIAFHEAAAARAPLARSIQGFVAALRRKGREDLVQARAESLFDVLLAPLHSHIRDRRRLVFVPDGLLFGLPFAALAERGRSGFLLEEHEVVVAPSASVYLRCSEKDRELGRAGQGQVLAVGNPTVPESLGPVGGSLPAAETEAVRVAGLYPRAVLLTGEDATASRFLRRAAESEIVHFAGHAHVNELYPLLSALLLAPEPGQEGSGPLFAHQIYRQRLGRTRLVILAACSTGRGGSRFAEEAIGLVRPFLAAGTPAVVASLSEIEDAASVQLLTAFHRHYAVSRDPVAALRQAQLERIRSVGAREPAPWSWASFQVFGGSAFSR